MSISCSLSSVFLTSLQPSELEKKQDKASVEEFIREIFEDIFNKAIESNHNKKIVFNEKSNRALTVGSISLRHRSNDKARKPVDISKEHIDSLLENCRTLLQKTISEKKLLEDASLKRFFIGSKEVVLGDYLGAGSHGEVFKATFDNAIEVAVKVNKIFKDFKSTAHFQRVLKKEAAHLKELSRLDPEDKYSVVRYISSSPLGAQRFCLIEELYSVDFYKLLEKTQKVGLSLKLISNVAKQLFATLAFFKNPAVNLIHCDLKPQNILLGRLGGGKIRIADFGSSRPSP